MKGKVLTTVMACLLVIATTGETFETKKGGNQFFPIPDRHFETVGDVRYGYIVDNGRAMIFSWDYNMYSGYAFACTAVVSARQAGNGSYYYHPWDIYGKIVVPSHLGGLPVTKIGRRAFQGCSHINAIEVPEGVVDIEYFAFATNSALRTFTCAASVTNINGYAFEQCTNLASIVLKGNTKIQYVVSGATNLRKLSIPVMKVTESFYANNVTNLVFTDKGSRALGAGMFQATSSRNCNKVESLTLLGDFSIAQTTFSGVLPNLNEVRVGRSDKISVEEALKYANKNAKIVLIDDEGNVICSQPVITPTDETVFENELTVSMSCDTTNATIHYTLDGSEPTEQSLLYGGSITIADTTTIKAKAFKADCMDSDTTEVTFVRWRDTVATPTITPAGGAFENTHQQVEIYCTTENAEIWYTTDGSDPLEKGRIYRGSFDIYMSCTIRAVAKRFDWHNSLEATSELIRVDSLGEAANLYGYTMETDEVVPWVVDGEVSHDGVLSVRSGAIGNNGMTWLQTSIKKAGTVSFWWKVACEEADEEEGEDGYYDYGAFLVDNVVVARVAGHDGEWHYVSHEVASGGKHTLKWEYRKDGATSYAPDCIWVDQVQWIPADGSGSTLTTPEAVPYSWLSGYGLGAGTDFETAASALSGKVQSGKATRVWEEWVAGTDPTNVTSRFVAKIEMCNGEPVVTWEPDLNTNGIQRMYKVYGKENLTDATWAYPTNSLHRFFKVTVEMP